MKAKILLVCILSFLTVNLISCAPKYRFNDYRGYYHERDYKEHHRKTKPPHDRD